MTKAIFLDRDGTIIVDKCYLSNPDDVEFLPQAKEALKIFHSLGFKLFIVSNQSGIGRGMFTSKEADAVNKRIQDLLLSDGIPPFSDIVYCPHAPEDDSCQCRKPSPVMIHDLAQKWGIDLSPSYMVGDKVIDAECGENAGTIGILLAQTPHPKFKTYNSLYSFALSLTK